MNPITDPHSFSDLSGTRLTHLDWNAEIDFTHRKIKATATWTLEYQKDTLILDENGLRILSVKDQDGHLLPFEEHEVDSIRGGWIKIVLHPNVQKIAIEYETMEHPAALQWLEVNQTLGKRYPILFTQSQAILARSWLPCMDSPSIRFTYSARVKVPQGMLALMSAENPKEKSPDGVYTFSMKQPIPSYLMALAVGDFEFRAISDRSGIYAEPELIDAAQNEFSDVEKMISAAETLYGAYLWDRYDLLVLPPSFPFGGMENPRLTFVTPTVIAGDKSLVSLIAHELAHSWSGNLVTNATWNDFWLNEGFTVYFELRIMEQLYGVEYAEMLAQLSYNELLEAINTLPPDETTLKAKLDGKNPDDAVGPIAYEKGYFFLRTVEKKVGRKFFDEFLKKYFDEHKFKSITTEDFLEYLKSNLLKKKEWEEINVESWVYEPGLPSTIVKPNSTKFSAIESTVVSFLKTKVVPITSRWTALEYIYFLQNLKGKIDEELCKKLDNHFRFTHSKNSEILAIWFLLCIETNYRQAWDAMKQFTVQTGRRKFVIPIYRELIKNNQIQLAKSIFQEAAKNYHPITYKSVAQLFENTL
ncbi:M1 family metallopeptidase [Thermaurantimonas aggregans]|nr:M1 family metallopeptidase [Thermaurantimonas aggregans]MCX8147942.1 M1 family metallopeptidase [Thermaurantimonas aggregans]